MNDWSSIQKVNFIVLNNAFNHFASMIINLAIQLLILIVDLHFADLLFDESKLVFWISFESNRIKLENFIFVLVENDFFPIFLHMSVQIENFRFFCLEFDFLISEDFLDFHLSKRFLFNSFISLGFYDMIHLFLIW